LVAKNHIKIQTLKDIYIYERKKLQFLHFIRYNTQRAEVSNMKLNQVVEDQINITK